MLSLRPKLVKISSTHNPMFCVVTRLRSVCGCNISQFLYVFLVLLYYDNEKSKIVRLLSKNTC